jgi:hypothetical protein
MQLLEQVLNFVEISQAIRAPYWRSLYVLVFISSTSIQTVEKFHIWHTNLTPYTHDKLNCYHSIIKSTLHENRSTFSDVSRLPVEGCKSEFNPGKHVADFFKVSLGSVQK